MKTEASFSEVAMLLRIFWPVTVKTREGDKTVIFLQMCTCSLWWEGDSQMKSSGMGDACRLTCKSRTLDILMVFIKKLHFFQLS